MLETTTGLRGMVTSPHHLASAAGLNVLRDGGNAIEAAIATAASLAVVYPHMNGIGGDSFWLVVEPDRSARVVQGCGAAAALAEPSLYLDQDLSAIPHRGPLAALTVAGTLSAWEELLASGCTLPLERILEEAIDYADKGSVAPTSLSDLLTAKQTELSGNSYLTDLFYPDGRPLKTGTVFKQPALAETFKTLARDGLRSAYEGRIAQAWAHDLEAVGAPLRLDDLKAHRARAERPLVSQTSLATLYNMPPPTQGLISLLILSAFDRLDADEADGFAHIHGLVEATKWAMRRSRQAGIGDPDWMSEPAQSVLDKTSDIAAAAASIDANQAMPWNGPSADGDTVWFGAVDNEGRMVSAIQSVYHEFGSGVMLPETGVIWQNRGASFSLVDGAWNALAPGRLPFHTLNPAAALFPDGRSMVYGTMGGEGQPQSQAAIFTRYARFGVPLQAAVTAPRWLLGRTWGDESTNLKIESRIDPTVVSQLIDAGHDVQVVEPFTSTMGHAGALVRRSDGVIEGATDPRSDGGVAAW
ncbi:MAG: gamma-glutamyltransferase [Pseudomonadota bacterium]